jgi:hypothetical protein
MIDKAMPKKAPKKAPPAKGPSGPTSPVQPGAAPIAPGAAGQAGGDQPTPQEQNAYERVVMAGMKVLYDNSTHPGIMNMLTKSASDPAKALADTVSMIMLQLDKKSGGKIPEMVILPAAAELLGDVAELASKAGVFTVDENTATKAMQLMVMSLAENYGVQPEDVQALMQSFPPDEIKGMVAKQSQAAGSGAAPAKAAPAAAPAAATPTAPSAPAQPGG